MEDRERLAWEERSRGLGARGEEGRSPARLGSKEGGLNLQPLTNQKARPSFFLKGPVELVMVNVMASAKFLGTTDEVTTCECCGRSNLKGTVALELEDGGLPV